MPVAAMSSGATLVSTLASTFGSMAGPVLSALITGVGGVLLGRHLSDKATQEQFRKSVTLEIIHQRIRLIERAVHILHRTRYYRAQHEILEHQVWLRRPETYQFLKKLFNEFVSEGDFTVEKWLDLHISHAEALSIAKENDEATAEFAAVANLCGLYFGPKTRKALRKVADSDQWHCISMEDRDELLSILFEELSFFSD